MHQTFDDERGGPPPPRLRERFSTADYERTATAGEAVLISGYSSMNTVTSAGHVARDHGRAVTCNLLRVLPPPPWGGFGTTATPMVPATARLVHVSGRRRSAPIAHHRPQVLFNRERISSSVSRPKECQGVDFTKCRSSRPISPAVLDPGRHVPLGRLELALCSGAGEAQPRSFRTELGVIAARIDEAQAPRETTLAVDRHGYFRSRSARETRDRCSVMSAFGSGS